MDQDTSNQLRQVINREAWPGAGVTPEGISIYAIYDYRSPTGFVLADGTVVNRDGSLYVVPKPKPWWRRKPWGGDAS